MNKHELSDLYQMQSLSLDSKIRMTKRRVRSWIDEYGTDGVYISFSGGKDSTVLLDIVREDWPDVPAVFVDTGLEYPEIREFVKSYDDVEWIRPKMNFRSVIEKYGYPFISKEVSLTVWEVRKALEKGKTAPKNKMLKLDGKAVDKKTGKLSAYNIPQWKFMLEAPFNISHICCNVMKKGPAHDYTKRTGRKPITAQMACESRLRTQLWLKNGCNGFDMKNPISNPMAFWTEQDVLLYFRIKNLKICSIYGEIVTDDEESGQINIADLFGMNQWEIGKTTLHTTGCDRTGCMFCGFGCHLEKPGKGRFERIKKTHPKIYNYIMSPWEYEIERMNPETLEMEKVKMKGLNYKEVIDWINQNGGQHIRY